MVSAFQYKVYNFSKGVNFMLNLALGTLDGGGHKI